MRSGTPDELRQRLAEQKALRGGLAKGETSLIEETIISQEEIDEVRRRYPDWEITRQLGGGPLVARHRKEKPDPEREKALIQTRITATYPEQLSTKLFVQTCLRNELSRLHVVPRADRPT